jgi:hypothetical protein
VLGGGAGIVVDGTYCTLASIGHQKSGQLVGFTAGHCGGPGAPVVAEGARPAWNPGFMRMGRATPLRSPNLSTAQKL